MILRSCFSTVRSACKPRQHFTEFLPRPVLLPSSVLLLSVTG